MFFLPALALLGSARAQVTATFPNGATNPSEPNFYPVGSQVNQTSMSRLLTLNGVDDFCLYGPPVAGPENTIGSTEPIVVAYCTKPRNNARLIPDGAITAAHFIRTPYYVQIHGFWDGTQMNIPEGDSGGELDPHGPDAVGNPIGGNVTSDVSGEDVFYEEWMSFISYDQFCLRICTAQPEDSTTALMCEHELDIMGCQFVMAIGDFYQSNNSFTSCEGDAAAPPGLYPLPGGGTSTFRQRYTGTYTADGTIGQWTIGNTVTPSAPYTIPATSNCITYSTISNGINTDNFNVESAPVLIDGSSSATASVGSTSQSRSGGAASTSGSASGSGSASRSGSSGSAGPTASGAADAAETSAPNGAAAAANMDSTMFTLALGVVGVVVGAATLF